MVRKIKKYTFNVVVVNASNSVLLKVNLDELSYKFKECVACTSNLIFLA